MVYSHNQQLERTENGLFPQRCAEYHPAPSGDCGRGSPFARSAGLDRNPLVTINPRLDGLGEYTFTQLNMLLAPIAPRANQTPVVMSVGDPLHATPAFLAETVARHADV